MTNHHFYQQEGDNTISALDIANLALGKIGEPPLDAILPNASTAARLCHIHYHPARREVLCLARWTFATTKCTLCVADPDGPHLQMPYCFTLPADCLRVLHVSCSRWALHGRKLHTSSGTIELTYLIDEEDTILYDPLFVDALATRLAEKLALPLTGNATLRAAMGAEFHRIILPTAATVNAQQAFSNDMHPLRDLFRRLRHRNTQNWENQE